MITTAPQESPVLQVFFEHVRYSNPFAVNRVVPTAVVKEDAADVHRHQFARLVNLAYQAQKEHIGLGALVWGEAGIGKSHLLGRLQNWAGLDHRQALFVYLTNLQAAPDQLPRSLLRSVVSIVTRGRTSRFFETPLYRVMNAALRRALHDDGSRIYPWHQAETAYERMIDELSRSTPANPALVDRQTYTVLLRFFLSSYLARDGNDDGLAALAIRWLAGDSLELDEAKSVGILSGFQPGEAVTLEDDEHIKKVLAALAQVASFRGQPLILCFDQVDNLEPEQFTALARFLHALLDSAANLLVITSGLRSVLTQWESDGVISKSTWDRLGQHEVELQRVSAAEALLIVQARLRPFLKPFLLQAPVHNRIEGDHLFPLGKPWVDKFLEGKIELRPRDVISWASEGWQGQQKAIEERGGHDWLTNWQGAKTTIEPGPQPTAEEIQQVIDTKVDHKLEEHKRQRQLSPETLPPDFDNLAGLIYTLLQRCLNSEGYESLLKVERLVPSRYGSRPAHNILLHQRFGSGDQVRKAGLLCLVTSNKTSATYFLRRLVEDTQPPERLIVITDERRPLELGPKGREYWETIKQRYGNQFHHEILKFGHYAELDALEVIIRLARSGDLEIELPGGQTRRLNEQEIIESHHRQGRYPAHPLLQILLTEKSSPGDKQSIPPQSQKPGCTPVKELDVRQFIMGRLAITMGSSSNELAVLYQDYLGRKDIRVRLEQCKASLEETAKRLHQEGHINATPHDDYLYLLIK